MRDALGVVEAVNSENQLAIGYVRQRQFIGEGVRIPVLTRPESIGVYADWEHPQPSSPAAVAIFVAVRFAAKLYIQRIYQVAHVALLVHPHEVVLQQRFQHFTRPGQYAEYIRRREGHMQKEA